MKSTQYNHKNRWDVKAEILFLSSGCIRTTVNELAWFGLRTQVCLMTRKFKTWKDKWNTAKCREQSYRAGTLLEAESENKTTQSIKQTLTS